MATVKVSTGIGSGKRQHSETLAGISALAADAQHRARGGAADARIRSLRQAQIAANATARQNLPRANQQPEKFS
jgi:predicted NBD/HSP70 family sugar kinase